MVLEFSEAPLHDITVRRIDQNELVRVHGNADPVLFD
jgi:hypothetical protein